MPGLTTDDTESTIDMGAAVDDIGAGLGFGTTADDGDDDLGLGEGAGTDEPVSLATPAADVTDVVDKTAPAATTATPAATAQPADAPPKTWRKEASALWAAIPSEAKAEILKREEDIFKGLEGYKAEANFGKTMRQVIAPYEQILRSANIDPVQHLSGLMQAHHIMATGTPQAKAAFFQRLAQDYRVDLSQLTGAAADDGNAPYVDPAVLDLRQQLQLVQSQLSDTARARQQDAVETNRRQVDAFAADPKHAYFNEVADDMVALLNSKLAPTLEEAYEQAVWRNPVTRAKEIDRKAAEASKATVTAATAQAVKAKAATAANVKTSAKSGSAATPTGSLDDTLSETLAAIKARA